VTIEVPLPWERLLWRSRPWHPSRLAAGERYLLTDVRLVHLGRGVAHELALEDIGDIHRIETRFDRVLHTCTLIVSSQRRGDPPIALRSVRRGRQLAVLLELLARDPHAPRERAAVRAALAWEPRTPTLRLREAAAGVVGVLIAMTVLVVVGLRGKTASAVYAPDDAIAPNGEKRSEADIVAFMERDVMPWARITLGHLKGDPERITCETCHGQHADSRDWHMPAVVALPQPDVRERGFEIYNRDLDAQVRNAIYGYLAESENQTKAAYMREVVLPGMAALLHRPAYDFTQPYGYNRSRHAIGCYHCHRVK
jgi:hypothetical protein